MSFKKRMKREIKLGISIKALEAIVEPLEVMHRFIPRYLKIKDPKIRNI